MRANVKNPIKYNGRWYFAGDVIAAISPSDVDVLGDCIEVCEDGESENESAETISSDTFVQYAVSAKKRGRPRKTDY